MFDTIIDENDDSIIIFYNDTTYKLYINYLSKICFHYFLFKSISGSIFILNQ